MLCSSYIPYLLFTFPSFLSVQCSLLLSSLISPFSPPSSIPILFCIFSPPTSTLSTTASRKNRYISARGYYVIIHSAVHLSYSLFLLSCDTILYVLLRLQKLCSFHALAFFSLFLTKECNRQDYASIRGFIPCPCS